MCGIFGIHYFDPQRPVNQQMVLEASDVMHHRGPDDSGYFVDGSTGLGHRRLSIIDLSSGHQPMTNENGGVIVVYNGEIYNYKEIKEELIGKGHIFRTDCDTEVIVHGYEEWGTDCLQKFNGMFAFLLFDKARRLLWGVRDRLGIKPLYYYHDNDVFIAASEVKALLKTGLVKSALNENVLDAYFSVGYVPGPETMFLGIKKVLPGHYLLVGEGKVEEHEYWDFAEIEYRSWSENEAIERVEALLTDCVRKRLVSDVPVGAFLSGGLDSSVVVALMDGLIAPEPVSTFTVAYHEGYSEKEYARIVADQFRTNHHEFYLEADDFFSSLETLVRFAEEPIVEPAAIALYHIAKLAREHATVLLSGEGSDEVFGGYYLYQFMSQIEKIRKYTPNILLAVLPSLGSFSPKLKNQKYLDWMNLPLSQRYQGTSSYLTPSLKKRLYHSDFLNSKSAYLEDQFAGYFKKVEGKDPLTQMLYVDTKTWLVDDLLVKADKMTMAASIELRVPFLDYRLIETVAGLAADLKIRNGNGKYLLKKISEKFLPRRIIFRKKMGFPVPTQEWLNNSATEQLNDLLLTIKDLNYFKAGIIDSIMAHHRKKSEDNSKLIMSFLVLAEWYRMFAV